jgi:hypothetical protein
MERNKRVHDLRLSDPQVTRRSYRQIDGALRFTTDYSNFAALPVEDGLLLARVATDVYPTPHNVVVEHLPFTQSDIGHETACKPVEETFSTRAELEMRAEPQLLIEDFVHGRVVNLRSCAVIGNPALERENLEFTYLLEGQEWMDFQVHLECPDPPVLRDVWVKLKQIGEYWFIEPYEVPQAKCGTSQGAFEYEVFDRAFLSASSAL